MERPDHFDAALSALHATWLDLGPWLAVWAARSEPDAHARRCASDAIGAIDAALVELHGVRARLVAETRQADDATAIRADELLARTRDGPRSTPSPEAARLYESPATTTATGLRGQPGRESSMSTINRRGDPR